MAADIPDEFLGPQEMGIRCPKCGNQLHETIARLKENPKLVCSCCGATSEFSELKGTTDKMNKAIDDFRKNFRKLSK